MSPFEAHKEAIVTLIVFFSVAPKMKAHLTAVAIFFLLGAFLAVGVVAQGPDAWRFLGGPIAPGGNESDLALSPATPLRPMDKTASDCPTTSPAAPPVHNLQDLLSGCDYASWFQANAGFEPDERYFSAYKILPWDDALYLGFGKARPAEYDGSLFARFQSDALTALYQPSEQGFIDMTQDVTLPVIHIPGPDPTDPAESGGSQWDWGNAYVFTPTVGAMTKQRNLPDVIHTWGLESAANGLYAAVSSHLGDYQTWTGEVFRSDDQGESWMRMANKDDGVGNYRTYDIITFDNNLYVTWNDVYGQACGLAESVDGGTTWTRLPEFTGSTLCRTRLFIYNNHLLALGFARDSLRALHSDGSVTIHTFPGFHAQDWAYNPFAIDNSNRLYIVSADNRILRTSDLNAWETLVASDRDFITLSYWPNQDKIIIGDRGLLGRLWTLDPAATAIQPPAAPNPTIAMNGNDVVIQSSAQSGVSYRIYRHTVHPYAFAPAIQYFYASASSNVWTDPGVGATSGGVYYQIRGKNTAGDISGASKTLGKFTFSLTPGS